MECRSSWESNGIVWWYNEEGNKIISKFLGEWIKFLSSGYLLPKSDNLIDPSFLFNSFGNPNFEGESTYLPNKEKFLKYYRNQVIKEFVNKRHSESELINQSIVELHSDCKPKLINQHLKQLSNGLCWYSDDYIKEKYKTQRISSSWNGVKPPEPYLFPL